MACWAFDRRAQAFYNAYGRHRGQSTNHNPSIHKLLFACRENSSLGWETGKSLRVRRGLVGGAGVCRSLAISCVARDVLWTLCPYRCFSSHRIPTVPCGVP